MKKPIVRSPLKKGQRVYHATSSPEDFDMIYGPGWVSDNKKAVEFFSTWHGHSDDERRPRIMTFEVVERQKLVFIKDDQAWQDMLGWIEERFGEEVLDTGEIADTLCRVGFDGWHIVDNYSPGSDTMLCHPERFLRLVEVDPVAAPRRHNPTHPPAATFIAYHGTNARFRKPSLKKSAEGVFWFTSDLKKISDEHVGIGKVARVLKLEVTMHRPAGWKEYDQLVLGQLKRDFDGVILPERSTDSFDGFVWDLSQVRVLSNTTLEEAMAAHGRHQNPLPKDSPWVFREAFVYALTRRPASAWTVPKGFVELGPATAELPFGTVTFKRPLPRAQIESFELEPLDPEDPIVLRRARQAYRDEVYDIFTRTHGFDQPDAEGGHTTLSNSTRQGVRFQVTFWLPDWTPTGHLDVNDFDEAVGTLWASMSKAERRLRVERSVWRHR